MITTAGSDPGTEEAATTRYRATSVVVGAATVVWDRLAPARERPGWREVAVGAVFEVEDAAAAMLTGVRRAVALPRLRPVTQPSGVVDRGRRRVARLAERGTAEEAHGRGQAADAVDSVIATLATAPVVERLVDAQVDRLLRPLVVSVLDDILSLLEENPERIQTLIQGQRDSMINELVGRIRQSTSAGDSAVDRVTARVLGRAEAPTTPPAPGTPTLTPASPATAHT